MLLIKQIRSRGDTHPEGIFKPSHVWFLKAQSSLKEVDVSQKDLLVLKKAHENSTAVTFFPGVSASVL